MGNTRKENVCLDGFIDILSIVTSVFSSMLTLIDMVYQIHKNRQQKSNRHDQG